MLNIYFGEMPEAIYNTSVYFNNTYLDSWILEDYTKELIRKIDKATVLSAQAVDSKALGVIPITKLSGGVKTLILIDHETDKVFNASTCGDNCAKYILQIADRHEEDITINLHHLMMFKPDGRKKKFDIRILNTNEIVHTSEEYILTAGSLLHEVEML